MIVATAGHVDHGKSTLVRLMTGVDPDRWAEEKRRGLTIDLGFAQMHRAGVEFAFVDVPGHQRYLSNMLAGCGAVDIALLVVSAREGWMPQTEEHLQIIDLLAVHRGVVALTHTDTVDTATIGERTQEVSLRLQATSLADAPILATAWNAPASIESLADALVAAARTSTRRDGHGCRPRLWIDRSFTAAGAGRIVTGTVTGGSIKTGDTIGLYERGAPTPCLIRSLHVFGNEVGEAVAGTRAGVALSGTRSAPRRGWALARPGDWSGARRWHVALEPMRGLDKPIPARGGYQVFTGTARVPAQLRYFPSGAELPPRHTGNKTPVLARLHLAETVGPISIGDRFILRDEGSDSTVGGGTVLAMEADPAGRNSDHLTERWVALANPRGEDRFRLAAVLVRQRGGAIAEPDLRRQVGPLHLDVQPLPSRAGLRLEHGHLVTDTELTRRRAELSQQIDHGLTLPVDELGFVAAATLIDAGEAEIREAQLVRPGSRSHQAQLVAALDAISRLIDETDHHVCKPDVIRASTGLGSRPQSDLIRSGELVAVGPLVTTKAHFERLTEAVCLALHDGPNTVSHVRSCLGLPRSVAIPLLETLGSIGCCTRDGALHEWASP